MDTLTVHSVTSIVATHATSLVAHQGGWDEFLLVAGPIAVIVGLLAVVKRRIDARFDPIGTNGNDGGDDGDDAVAGSQASG